MNATITVIGRRWFEKISGNTYHSTEVYVSGKLIQRVPFTYGYDSAYEQTAREILAANIPGYEIPNGQNFEALWRAAERNWDQLVISVTDVQRKKDL